MSPDIDRGGTSREDRSDLDADPMWLERIEPSLGRGERLRLDAAQEKVSLGRAEDSDVRLYTVSASREHALIAANTQGQWILTPVAGKSVLVDGQIATQPVMLEVGLNIILGQDHLRCVAEEDVPRRSAARAAPASFKGSFDRIFQDLLCSSGRLKGPGELGWWAIGVVATIGIGWVLFAR